MDDSDSSSLSSAPSIDDEVMVAKMNKTGLHRFFNPVPKSTSSKTPATKDAPSPPPPKRPDSPPHEYVLSDNADIAFIVMFRSRFSSAFPKSLPHYGPQDIETGIAEVVPGEHVERLLCALLGLVLNRKKDVERGHYGRALEEAIQTHSAQWPTVWKGVNPLHGGGNFNNMSAEQRLVLLKTLILWSLSGSEAVQTIIKDSYKQARHEDDKNQPLSVQPWGKDGYKRNYWLIEGQDDTHFRLYRENNGTTAKTNTWFSVAGSIDEVLTLATKLDDENTPHSRTLRDRIRAAVPRFEAGEEKRRRRDYRMARKAAFARPEPGFSLYEGRTRGKRMKYSYSDDDEDGSDFDSTKRSTRNSGMSTPAESAGPTITASGRQVKSRLGGMYGETMLIDQRKGIENERSAIRESTQEAGDDMPSTNGRQQRARVQARSGRSKENFQENLDSQDDSDKASSEGEWSGNEDEPDDSEPDYDEVEEDEEMSANESGGEDLDTDENTQESLVVQLRYKKENVEQEQAITQYADSSAHPTSTYEEPAAEGSGSYKATVNSESAFAAAVSSENGKVDLGGISNSPLAVPLQQQPRTLHL